jgi:hypothetical protein
MFTELLSITTFEDQFGNKEISHFRQLYVEVERDSPPKIIVVIEDEIIRPSGYKSYDRWSMEATNNHQVPVVNAQGVQKTQLVNLPGPNGTTSQVEQARTIGEFDMWKQLVFENNVVSLNQAFAAGIYRQKGLAQQPLVFMEP